jgi:hypothetical protein
MALNIAVTSKFDPFTQEDYIKPLANYWKEYEKYEDALYAENAKLAALDPYLEYFTEGDAELKAQYDKYKQSLESARDQMSQGLNAQTRRQIRGEILPMYGSHIVPIQEAFQKKAAAITEYQKQAAHNPLLLSSHINPLNMSVSSFYGINNGTPGYFTEDGNKVVNDIKNAIGNFTGSHIVEQTRDVEDKRITEKVTGYPRISMSIIGGQIKFKEGTNKELVGKITKMYNDAKDQYKYSELDDTSRNIFDRSFASGIDQGWIYSKHTGSAPKPKILTPTHEIEEVRDNNGNSVKAHIWINEDGHKIYSIGGKNYRQKDIDDWADKYQKGLEKKKADEEQKAAARISYSSSYEAKQKEKSTLVYSTDPNKARVIQRDYLFASDIGGEGDDGEAIKYYDKEQMNGEGNQEYGLVLDHMINAVVRRLGDTYKEDNLLVEKDDGVSLLTAGRYSNLTHQNIIGNYTNAKKEDYVYLRYDGNGGDYHIVGIPVDEFAMHLAHRFLSEKNGYTAKQIAAVIRGVEKQRGANAGTLLDTIVTYASNYGKQVLGGTEENQAEIGKAFEAIKDMYKELYGSESSTQNQSSQGVKTGVPMDAL